MKKFIACGATLGLIAIGSGVMAAGETVTLPVVMDIGEYISTGITALGVVAAVAVGGFAAFWVVKKALSWFGIAGGAK